MFRLRLARAKSGLRLSGQIPSVASNQLSMETRYLPAHVSGMRLSSEYMSNYQRRFKSAVLQSDRDPRADEGSQKYRTDEESRIMSVSLDSSKSWRHNVKRETIEPQKIHRNSHADDTNNNNVIRQQQSGSWKQTRNQPEARDALDTQSKHIGRIERQTHHKRPGEHDLFHPSNRRITDTYPNKSVTPKKQPSMEESFERLRAVFLTRPVVHKEKIKNRNNPTSHNTTNSSNYASKPIHETPRHYKQAETQEDNYQEKFLNSGMNHGQNQTNHNKSSWRHNFQPNNSETLQYHAHQTSQSTAFNNTRHGNKGKGITRHRRNVSIVEQEKIVTLPLHAKNIPLAQLAAMTRESVAKLLKLVRYLGEEVALSGGMEGTVRSLNKQARRNLIISIDAAELVALELGYQVKHAAETEKDLDLLLSMDVNASLLDEEEVLLQQMEFEEMAANEGTVTSSELTPPDRYKPRPPVVCIMGHVDHGKTTLMDTLRQFAAEIDQKDTKHNLAKALKKKSKGSAKKKSNEDFVGKVAGTEAGGITQMISAFQVSLPSREEAMLESLEENDDNDTTSHYSRSTAKVTFLDTPGHAAFTKMRHCSMYATDLLVLVIAADDGIKEQTKEIIEMYQSQSNKNLRLVVAMTKIDKVGTERIRECMTKVENQLIAHGIETLGLGGSVPIVPVSSITLQGIEELVRVLADRGQGLMWDVTSEEGMGVVLDARVERGLGVVVDCVVRNGTFVKGGHVVVERKEGRIRLLKDVNNQSVEQASPSQPVRIVGLDFIPKAGEAILCVSEDRAKEIVGKREDMYVATSDKDEANMTATSKRPERLFDPIADLEITNSKTAIHRKKTLLRFGLIDKDNKDVNSNAVDDFSESDSDETIRIPVIIKADADGTLHAIESALYGIVAQSRHNILLDPIKCGVGPINASDIMLASESNAPIIGFNVLKDKTTLNSAEAKGVQMVHHKIIYSLLDEAKVAFAQYLPPVVQDLVHGRAKVQTIFRLTGKNAGVVAGCQVSEGTLYVDKSESGSKVAYRVVRDGKIIAGAGSSQDSPLRASSLKRFKDDANQIKRGEECGLALADFDGFEDGDIIECFTTELTRSFD